MSKLGKTQFARVRRYSDSFSLSRINCKMIWYDTYSILYDTPRSINRLITKKEKYSPRHSRVRIRIKIRIYDIDIGLIGYFFLKFRELLIMNSIEYWSIIQFDPADTHSFIDTCNNGDWCIRLNMHIQFKSRTKVWRVPITWWWFSVDIL